MKAIWSWLFSERCLQAHSGKVEWKEKKVHKPQVQLLPWEGYERKAIQEYGEIPKEWTGARGGVRGCLTWANKGIQGHIIVYNQGI